MVKRCLNSVLNVKVLVGNQEKALVGAFSVIVKSLANLRFSGCHVMNLSVSPSMGWRSLV